MKDKLTVQEAAKYLGTTRQKVSRLIARGVLTTEENPLDTRQKLISREQLERLKTYKDLGEEEISGKLVPLFS